MRHSTLGIVENLAVRMVDFRMSIEFITWAETRSRSPDGIAKIIKSSSPSEVHTGTASRTGSPTSMSSREAILTHLLKELKCTVASIRPMKRLRIRSAQS